MLELKKITKKYILESNKVEALKGIDLKFRESEFVSILGPSGCGKTTLLNIIGGLDNYTTGDLLINGKSTKHFSDRDWDIYRNHSIGFVFQNYNLIPHQTVLQNVELALTLAGVSKTERRKKAIQALKDVGLGDQINKKPNQMSGGQMQRVAIARALVSDPDILLADEPTGALDSETSIQVMELLKKIAQDRLVIMVTHNPDLADKYSTRIVKLLDGKITHDSNPYNPSKENKPEKKNTKTHKTSMSFLTAFSLSLNNLMTKKGRTFLTAFAGSIGIIGIALILSLSHGIQNYIDKTEEETLSSYPLIIQKETIDMASMIESFAGNQNAEPHDDNKIHSVNIMGDLITSMTSETKTNDLKSFKTYLDTNEKFKNLTSDIQYSYDVTMNLYKNDLENIVRVNPTTVFDAIGMSTDSLSSAYSSYISNYDVFYEMLNNQELNEQQYDIVAGRWPKAYNELVLTVDENNNISDYTLYSLGILDQNYLKEQFNNLTTGKEVSFEKTSYTTEELLNLTFKLVLNTDYYQLNNGIWVDMSKNKEYMQEVLKNAEELKIVGIIKPNEEAVVGSNTYGLVGYTHELSEYLINKINATEIVKAQVTNPEINIFTGEKFSSNGSFDINSLSKEQLAYLQSLSETELAQYIEAYSSNMTSTYEQNIKKLGIAELDNPASISIYPKNFEAKEEITNLISSYNETKDEANQIEYTDIVGIMMSSISTIVDVISAVLIAFVAISLIVSSIMIAIITYISVIERTKEIGILRAVGASKKDISRVFNAETLIEGLAAGLFGIIVTIIINIPANIIIKNVVNISNLSKLPIAGAIILILISIILTVVAGLIPAKMASKKDPVEALRSE